MIRVQNRCLQRSLVAYLIAIFLGGMAVSQAVGQELVVKEQKFEGLEILELGAIVTPSADGPRVADVVPDAGRLEEYRGVNLQSGDLIVSVNGQLTKKLSDLQAILDPLVPGDTIRLALQRLGSFAVASYVVAAPEEAEKAAGAILGMEVKAHRRAGTGRWPTHGQAHWRRG